MARPMDRSQLIVGGWPDAAAHQVALALNEHPWVLLGFERYAKAVSTLDSHHFAPGRIVDPLPQETDVRGQRFYDRLRLRADADQLAYTGDAVPGYARMLDELAERLPRARFVVVLAPHPSTNGEPLEAWRAVAGAARASKERPYARRVFVLAWERCTADPEPWLVALLRFLELPGSPRLEAEWVRVTAAAGATLAPALVSSATAADAELEAWRSAHADAELEQQSGREPPTQLADPALSDSDVQAREAERAELLGQHSSRSAQWPDELAALRRRHRADARVIAERGQRLRERQRTAVRGLPDHSFRVTIVNPYDRTEVIAGHALDQLAVQLERLVSVRLIEGVDVDESAHAILCPARGLLVSQVREVMGADQRLVLLLDDSAGLEVVAADPGCEVIAPSSSLARAARATGARSVHIPLGLQPKLIDQPQPSDARGLTVTAQARVGERGGVEDLQAALVAVREARPEAEIVVFGGVPVDGATQFRLYPSIASVFKILRASAIHVATAREDRLGAIGALSSAAGSALISTATEGASEYAVPGLTALLAPVGDPDELAADVISLLDDPPLRARVADDGRRYIRQLLPSWQEVARRVAVMLMEAG